MKPKEKKPSTVCRIIDRNTGEFVGSYSRAYCDEYDFKSAYEARLANCGGEFTDEKKYKIARYKVTYELIEDDCDIEKDSKEYYKKDLERYKKESMDLF
jgi:hypothetical protein